MSALCTPALGAAQPTTSKPLARPDNYARTVITDHPVGYWQLNDPPGAPRARASAGGVDGYYHGNAATTTGGTGSRHRFDGVLDYVSVPNRPAWSQPTTGALTVEFWMRPRWLVFPHEEGSGYVWILGKGEPDQHEWGFRMYGADNHESPPRGNRIAFYAFNPVGGEGAGAYFQDTVIPGRWIYIVGELTLTGVKIYRNGVLRQGPPAAATLYASYQVSMRHGFAPLRIGTRNKKSFFAGAIGDVAIYPYLLSDSRIRAHFRAGAAAHHLAP